MFEHRRRSSRSSSSSRWCPPPRSTGGRRRTRRSPVGAPTRRVRGRERRDSSGFPSAIALEITTASGSPSALASWPTRTRAPEAASSRSPSESFRSEPETAIPLARKSRARFRIPAPPTPIRCTVRTPSNEGTPSVGIEPDGRSVQRRPVDERTLMADGHRIPHQLGHPFVGVGLRPRGPGLRHHGPSLPIRDEREDPVSEPLRRQVAVPVDRPRLRRAPAPWRSPPDGRPSRADTERGSTGSSTPRARGSCSRRLGRPRDRPPRAPAPSGRGTARSARSTAISLIDRRGDDLVVGRAGQHDELQVGSCRRGAGSRPRPCGRGGGRPDSRRSRGPSSVRARGSTSAAPRPPAPRGGR